MPIRIIYHPDEGQVTIMPYGFDGGSCHDAARAYEDTRAGKHVLAQGEAAGLSQEVAPVAAEIQQQARI